MSEKRRFPIYVKTGLIFGGFALVLVEMAMVFFTVVTSSTNQQNYKNAVTNLASTVAKVIDADKVASLKDKVKSIVDASEDKPLSDEWGSERWNTYIAQFDPIKSDPLFIEIRDVLRSIVSVNESSEVDCLYLSYVDPNGFFVYIVDSAPEEDACPPGCLDPLFDFNRRVLDDPSIGFPAYITNTEEYGWLVTAGAPIYQGDKVVAYAVGDVSMAAVRGTQRDNIIRLFTYLSTTVILLTALAILIIHFILIRPIKKLTKAADSYDSSRPEKNHRVFETLDVKTHDELLDLGASMKRMEADVYEKISELTQKNKELRESRQETNKMRILANKDGLTGVRNKVAYDTAAEQINQNIRENKDVAFGVVMIDLNDLKVLNDVHGHQSGDIALIKLSSIIGAIFAHSPVYRVGGDEFVVLLRHSDFENADELIRFFKQKIADLHADEYLPPAERISAAIGYATYVSGQDTCVEDVFKRADEAMYQNKREMKQKK